MSKLGETVTGAGVLGTRIAAAQRESNPEGRMPLMEHLRELRNRVVQAAAALLIGTAVGLIPAVFDRIWAVVERPFCQAKIHGITGCHRLGHELIVTGVLDPFMLRVEVAFFFGLIVTCPIWLYQIWAFIAPGLYRREQRGAYPVVGPPPPPFVGRARNPDFSASRGLGFLLGVSPPRGHNLLLSPPSSLYFLLPL